MLVYLAVRGEARRDELVDLLWGGVDEARARNAFRQALHRLRTALGEDVIPMDRDRVELVPGNRLTSDRDDLLAAIESSDTAGALDLYRGDFLEGFDLGEPVFDSWADAERVRLRGRFQGALQTGADAALAAGRWLEALQYVQRLTAVAPYDENAALLEANVLVAAGRGIEAAQSLRRFAQILRERLDIPVSAKVRETLARIERSEPAREAAGPRQAAHLDLPFIGREPEIARLMGLARRLAAEQGATVLVSGPAGIGKTRLLAEFISRAKSVGQMLVLRGRERPIGAALPYASVAEALRPIVRAPGVAGTGRHLMAEAARILPELRDVFELPEPGPIEAEGGRLRFFEGIAALVDAAAYEQPICLALDDMHNASPSTVELVGYLAARLQGSPVLILISHREGDDDGALSRLHVASAPRAPHPDDAEMLRLEPLDLEATRKLVESIVSTRDVGGQVDVARVAAAAGGNPLRAMDLAHRALDGEIPTATPRRLRDVLWDRLQKASPSQRRIFFAAALLQRSSSLRLLSQAAHLPEAATFEAAQELEDVGLLVQADDGYSIAHDFTSSFVAEASGAAGRAMLAGWAADALAAQPSPPAAELAHLYSIAGEHPKAFVHARRAVYDAAALGASPEVHRLLALALAMAPDASSRAQIEAMLNAFGAGRRLLDPPDKDAEPDGIAADIAIPRDAVTGDSGASRTAHLSGSDAADLAAAAHLSGSDAADLAAAAHLSGPGATDLTSVGAAADFPGFDATNARSGDISVAEGLNGDPPPGEHLLAGDATAVIGETSSVEPTSADRIGRRSPADSPITGIASSGEASPATRKGYRTRLLTPRLAALMLVGAVAIAAAFAWRNSRAADSGLRVLRDSLIVTQRGREASGALAVTGAIATAASRQMIPVAGQSLPAWADTLALPWIRPSASVSGLVAVERMAESGTDVYFMVGGASAPIPAAVGPGYDTMLGWSPDGRAILVRRSRTLPDGGFDADLWAFRLDDRGAVQATPLDTNPSRLVGEEAAWSPDGSLVAWTAQVGVSQQRDIFVSAPDGSRARNVTDDPADDYHIAWSYDGNLLGFTSDRTGNRDLFAIDFSSGGRRLWRLTQTPTDEDFLAFSPDGRFVAFQSTAGGDAAVYVMPSLGGVPTRVTPQGGQYSLVGWRGRPEVGYVDRFRIIGPISARVGDTVVLSLFGADGAGNTNVPENATIALLDSARAAALAPLADAADASRTYRVRVLRPGAIRIVASIPGWRHDTLTIQAGDGTSVGIGDDFRAGLSRDRWTILGFPRPFVRADESGASSLFPNGDAQWQSGILSRETVSLADSVDVTTTFRAPFGGRPVAQALLTLALVSEVQARAADSVATELAPLVGISWDGESSRFIYSVGRESRSDPVSALSSSSTHRVRFAIGQSGGVSFYIDGQLRWTSSIRFLGGMDGEKAALWIGGRATGDRASVGAITVSGR